LLLTGFALLDLFYGIVAVLATGRPRGLAIHCNRSARHVRSMRRMYVCSR
jgi:hypothetical protein